MAGDGHDRAFEELLRALDEVTAERTGEDGSGGSEPFPEPRRLDRELLSLLAYALDEVPPAAAARARLLAVARAEEEDLPAKG